MSRIRAGLTYANVMSTLAVFLVVAGGSAYAANQLAKNSVGPKQLKRNAVSAPKIKRGAVNASKIRRGAVAAPKLRDGAVATPKLRDGAVTAAKIAPGAVGPAQLAGEYLPADTPGVPVAGVQVAADGSVNRWFNRAGGAPAVAKLGPGSYRIVFPGLESQGYIFNSIAVASLVSTSAGMIARDSDNGIPKVWTFNAAGAPTDRAFDFLLVTPGGP
ncbi:MAG: hypothetical protein GXY03_15905 [Solirubrobacterales bacterium]|nr:hypothetical protein [Solirubrobacterales bacterium]